MIPAKYIGGLVAVMLLAAPPAHGQNANAPSTAASVFPLTDAGIAVALAKAACPQVPASAKWDAKILHVDVDNPERPDVPDFWMVSTVTTDNRGQIISTVRIPMDGPAPTACRQVPAHLAVVNPPTPARSAPVTTEKAACDLVRQYMVNAKNVPAGIMASCDFSESPPAGLYVMALQSNRKCPGICSRNMGWFAIRKADGRLFEWDVAELKLGPPLQQP